MLWNSKIDIRHTFLGESGGMPPRKVWTNHCPEIESDGFWQLADCFQVPITCVKNTAIFSSFKAINYLFIFHNCLIPAPPLCMKP